MRYTAFHVPPQLNPKHMSASYLKSELNTMWGRKAARSKTTSDEPPPEGRRGSHVVVIHLGSRYLRVGRASDVTPVTVPNVIARKTINAPAPTFVKGISRPRRGRARGLPSPPAANDESAVARESDDAVRPAFPCSPLPDPPVRRTRVLRLIVCDADRSSMRKSR